MKDFFGKFNLIEKQISQRKGEFELFAILLREDSPDKWDIVISAPWLKKEDRETLEFMTVVIKRNLKEDIIKLSRIVVLENNHPALKAIHRAINVKHGGAEIKDSDLFGLPIKHGYIVTSSIKSTKSTSVRLRRKSLRSAKSTIG